MTVAAVRAAFRQRRACWLALGLLVGLGVRSALTTSRSVYPELALPRIAIIAELGDVPARALVVELTRALEQAVAAVPGLVRMRSKTVRGAAELALDFADDADLRSALALVRARVAELRLPENVRITVEQETPAIFPVLSFAVVPGGDAATRLDVARLAEWVETDLQPRLARLEDVFRVTVQCGDRRELVFEADPAALASAGIRLEGVRAAIAAANSVAAVGRAEREGQLLQVVADSEILEPSELLEVVVAPADRPTSAVPLAALGRLAEAAADRTMIATGSGRDGVVVSVFLRDGGQVTRLSRDVAIELDRLRSAVPFAGHIQPIYDQATLVDASIAGVGEAIGLGAVLSVLVLLLFLGDWRATLVAGAAIPISIALALAAFPLLEQSLDLMSLGGLAIAVGLIIDDAIVVVDNVARRVQGRGCGGGWGRLGAISAAVAEVSGAVIGSSLTSVAVFAPLSLLRGVAGQFFRSLAVSLALAIAASLLVALVYCPLALLSPVLAQSTAAGRRWMAALEERYMAAVRWALARPLLSSAVLALALLPLLAGAVRVRTGFLPEMDEGAFVLDYFLPPGSSLAATDAVCRRIESILATTPEVTSFSRRTGAELGLFATDVSTGDFLVGLKPAAERDRDSLQLAEDLRERIAGEVPYAEVEFLQVIQDTIADLAGSPRPIEVKLFGADYRELDDAGERVAAALESAPELAEVMHHSAFGARELAWHVSRSAAGRLGLDARAVAAAARLEMLGEVATRIVERDRLVDIRVRASRTAAPPLDAPEGAPDLVVAPASAGAAALPLPLSAIARCERRIAESELLRENQTPMVSVTAAAAGGDLALAVEAAERAIAAVDLGPSVRVEIGGQAEGQARAASELWQVGLLGTALVLLLLVVQFKSLRLPLALGLALPFGQLGALCALQATGTALDVSSGMGLILLVGLVVKNGIILIESAQAERRAGASEREALARAARLRLRPILMTTAASIAGLAPLACGFGSGAALQRPLAIAVIGGLLASTAAGLFLVPVACDLLARHCLVAEVDHEN